MIVYFLSMMIICNIKRGIVLNAGNKYNDLNHIDFLKAEFYKNKDISFEYRDNDSLIAL